MDFLSLNRLNALVNTISGNMLPVTSEKTKLPIIFRIYWLAVWVVQLSYVAECILGVHYSPMEKALKDSTVGIAVALEAIVLSVYMDSRKDLLQKLIGQLNDTLKGDNETLKTVTVATVRPLEKVLKAYTVGTIGSVTVWALLQFIKVFRQKEFYYVDYRMPVVFSSEPFATHVFVMGGLFVSVGCTCTVSRKVSLDLYMIHLVRLMTAQYKYLRIRFAAVLRGNGGATKNDSVWRGVSPENEREVKRQFRLLTYHYESIIKMTGLLKKVLAPNIGVLYINNVFRFCFLNIMLVMPSTEEMEKYLIALYSIGALIQLYLLCFSIQELFEASRAVADDAFYEKWCVYDGSLQRVTSVMTFANKLECKLSSLRSIDLTLPSFMSILNQAYSVCLLFLKVK